MINSSVEQRYPGAIGRFQLDFQSPYTSCLRTGAGGVARALLQEATVLAAKDTEGFWSASPVHADSDAAGFMQACGFHPRRSTHYFRARFDVFSQHLTPLLNRLKAHGRIPQNARLAPLSEAPLEDISWLVSTEFGGGPFRTLHGLQRRSQGAIAELNDRSVALLHDEEVAGVMLWKVEDRDGRPTAVVEARVVAPRWRNGWPNLVMLESVIVQGQAEGLAEFIFHCDDTVRDTLSLARRSAAVEIDQNSLYYYAMAKP